VDGKKNKNKKKITRPKYNSLPLSRATVKKKNNTTKI